MVPGSRAVLGLDRQRAAERVEPEQRIRPRHQRNLRDGDARDQVPTHHVAERLVQPDAVHVDRKALRRAEQRRGGVAAVIHVRLERVALDFVDVDAVEARFRKSDRSSAPLSSMSRWFAAWTGRGISTGDRSVPASGVAPDDVNPERLGAQRQRDGSGNRLGGSNIDGHRLGGESTRRHLETVASIGQTGERMGALGIGLKASGRSRWRCSVICRRRPRQLRRDLSLRSELHLPGAGREGQGEQKNTRGACTQVRRLPGMGRHEKRAYTLIFRCASWCSVFFSLWGYGLLDGHPIERFGARRQADIAGLGAIGLQNVGDDAGVRVLAEGGG